MTAQQCWISRHVSRWSISAPPLCTLSFAFPASLLHFGGSLTRLFGTWEPLRFPSMFWVCNQSEHAELCDGVKLCITEYSPTLSFSLVFLLWTKQFKMFVRVKKKSPYVYKYTLELTHLLLSHFCWEQSPRMLCIFSEAAHYHGNKESVSSNWGRDMVSCFQEI